MPLEENLISREHSPASDKHSKVQSCSVCAANFTRKTHLNRHMRSHNNERAHSCNRCGFQFTRRDLLVRHKKTCGETRSRRKACEACAKAKVKCDLLQPCERCTSRGIVCEFTNDPSISREKAKRAARRKTREGSVSSIISRESAQSTLSIRSPTPEVLTPPDTSASLPPFNTEAFLPQTPASAVLDSSPAQFALLGPTPDVVQTGPGASNKSSFPGDLEGFGHEFMQSWLGSVQATPSGFELENASLMHGALGQEFNAMDMEPASTTNDAYNGMKHMSDSLNVAFPVDDSTEPSMILESTVFSSPATTSFTFPELSPSTTQQQKQEPETFVSEAERRVYMYFFFSAFSLQLPIIHEATWREDDKPQLLLCVMQACGALFVRTRQATEFVTNTLSTAWMRIVQEYSQTTDSTTQLNLLIASALLQCLGMFHQHASQRTSSALYHGLMKMMMLRTSILGMLQHWEPPEFLDDTPIEEVWRSWLCYEAAKRLCCLTHLQTCDYAIFHAMPAEAEWLTESPEKHLPCEEELWRARTAQEWVAELRKQSPYGTPTARLRGVSALAAHSALYNLASPMTRFPPYAHYLFIHIILSNIFSSNQEFGGRLSPIDAQSHQIALQNWLISWRNAESLCSPTASSIPTYPYASNAMRYYRLSRTVLQLSHEGSLEGLASASDQRFRLLKRWLQGVRDDQFSQLHEQRELREDVMRMRLLSASAGEEMASLDMQRGEEMENDGFFNAFIGNPVV